MLTTPATYRIRVQGQLGPDWISFFSLSLNALTIAHSNAGTSGVGGGLENFGGTVSISNSTFADNSASEGDTLFNNRR